MRHTFGVLVLMQPVKVVKFLQSLLGQFLLARFAFLHPFLNVVFVDIVIT